MAEKKSESVVRDIKRRTRRKYDDTDRREIIKQRTLRIRRQINLGNTKCVS